MAKGQDETKYRHTVSFSPNNEAQCKALTTYEMLLTKTDVNSLGSLFTKVLVIFAEQAERHPGINLELAQAISADELQEFLEWKRQRQNGQHHPPVMASPSPSPQKPASNLHGDDGISVDFDAL